MEIRPASPDGLILLNTQLNGPDFIAVAIRGGRVELWYDLGQGPATIVSPAPLELHRWHTITATRNKTYGQLQVNNQPPVTGRSPGYFTGLQVRGDCLIVVLEQRG